MCFFKLASQINFLVFHGDFYPVRWFKVCMGSKSLRSVLGEIPLQKSVASFEDVILAVVMVVSLAGDKLL